MNKNIRKIILLVGCVLLSVCFIASCSNLPGQVIRQLTAVPVSPVDTGTDTDNGGPAADKGDPGLIQHQIDEPWQEPEAGPTVTAIVLPVEKRGEEGAMIFRSDSDSSESYEIYREDETIMVYSTPTPMPVYSGSVSGLKDEMEVYSYAPVNSAVVLPNQSLHLDVTLRNTGTTTWQTTYKVVDTSGNPMTVLREYNMPYAVAPGTMGTLSIYMTAPAELGTYVESFSIQDAYGVVFGSFEYTLIVGGFSSITEIPTLTATITPTYYSAAGITATPDSLSWMCIDPERSKLQDCYQFCVEYSHREEFSYCFYDGIRYTTPIP